MRLLPSAPFNLWTKLLTKAAIRAAGATIHYILFSELRQHCEALCKFGDSPAAMRKIARSVS